WKLSIILFQFPFIIKNPLSIVYFDGGAKGYYLAIVLVLLYIALKVKKAVVSVDWVIYLILLTFTLYEIILHVLVIEPLWMKGIVFVVHFLFLLALFFFGRKEVWNVQLAILFPIVQVMLYSLHDQTYTSVITYGIFV